MKPIFNRAPLTPNTFSQLPVGAIRPEGWLLEEIKLQREGITAQFEKVCPEFACGKWIAAEDGDCTRSIYYLEGIIALGRVLNDAALIEKADRFVESILASVREDGFFGPGKDTDYDSRILALRALRMWFGATGDKRVLKLMDGFFRYEYKNLQEKPLREQAVAFGGENMEQALWLYNLTGQKYLTDLCAKLRAQTLDWTNFLYNFSNAMPMGKSQRWERLQEGLKEEGSETLSGENRPYFHCQYYFTRGDVLAAGLKTPAIINMFKSGYKEEKGFATGWEKLMKHHGTANGMFTCDDHINGANPCQGTTLLSVVETMNSMETMLGIGNFGMLPANVLEKVAYNALPAAFGPDKKTYQRVQQANQVRLSTEAHKWYNAAADAQLFTEAKNENNCAACHQAWPKFTSSLWYATNDDGLAAVSYAPCTVRAALDGNSVRLKVSGGYPFMDKVRIEVNVKQPSEFPLYLRIPFWARQAMVYLPDGEIMQVCANNYTCVRRTWMNGDVITLEIPSVPRITRWYHQSASVELGPLLMVLRGEPQWKQEENGMSATTSDEWNRALVREMPMKVLRVEEDVTAFGRGESAAGVMVEAAAIEWPMNGADCASVPMVPQFEKESVDHLDLVPYGDTALRVSEFPYGNIHVEKQKEIK